MVPSQISPITELFPFLTCLSASDWELAEQTRVTPLTPHVIREGHLLQHAAFILSGNIRVYKISPSGREVTLYRVHAGESCVLMLASILGEMPYEACVQIEQETELLLFPVEAFRQWANAYQPLRRYFYSEIVTRFTSVMTLLEQIAFGSIKERLGAFLMRKAAESSPVTGEIKITHELIALELGTAREVVSRALKDFAKDEVISLKKGAIIVKDPHKLLGEQQA